MRVFYKESGISAECWVEIWERDDWKVISESRLMIAGDTLIVDSITVYPPYQFKGYGTEMIKKIKSAGRRVQPVGVLKHSEGFWDKMTPGWRKGKVC